MFAGWGLYGASRVPLTLDAIRGESIVCDLKRKSVRPIAWGLWGRFASTPKLTKVDGIMAKINAQKIADALPGSGGSISQLARMIGCSRQALYAWLRRHPKTARALDAERNALLDRAEWVVIQMIEQGSFEAVKFYLNAKGRDRGYGHRSEIVLEPVGHGQVIIGDESKLHASR
jgi:hypothetical protein